MNRGETDMYLINSGGMNSDLAPDYLRLVYNSTSRLPQRAYGYKNPEVDQLTSEQLNTLDEGERKRTPTRSACTGSRRSTSGTSRRGVWPAWSPP